MAIIRVKERYDGSESEAQKGERKYRREYLVETDSNKHTARDIRLAPGIPRLGDLHNEDSSSRVTRVGTPQHASGSDNTWYVPVEYESIEVTITGTPIEEGREIINPETVLPRLQISTVDRTELLVKDINGKAVANSAGMRASTVPEVERSYREFSINGRVPFEAFTLDMTTKYSDKLNNKDFLGFAVDTVKIKNVQGQTEDSEFEQPDGTTVVRTVWVVTILGHVKESWLVRVLDEGTYKNPGAYPYVGGGEPTVFGGYDQLEPILDANGDPVREPVLLDGSGNPLAAGGEPVFLEYVGYAKEDFDELLDALGFPKEVSGYKVEYVKQEE